MRKRLAYVRLGIRSSEPPTNMQYGFFRIYPNQYAINIKQRGRGPIILRKYVRKYGTIGANYTNDIRRRLEALEAMRFPCNCINVTIYNSVNQILMICNMCCTNLYCPNKINKLIRKSQLAKMTIN